MRGVDDFSLDLAVLELNGMGSARNALDTIIQVCFFYDCISFEHICGVFRFLFRGMEKYP